MPFTPNTIVHLLSGVPLDNTYKDTLDFSSVTAQSTFFSTFKKLSFTNFTYQRERAAIRVPAIYDNIIDCNYVMYQNANYGPKWFYAFVTAINYLNPETSELIIEQDVMQTWLFDYTIKPSFIERETVDNDNLFQHTIPETVEFGPRRVGNSMVYDLSSMAIVMAYMPNNLDSSGGSLRDGVYTGLKYLWFGVTASEIDKLNDLIQSFANAGLLDDIISIFMVPAQFVLGSKASIGVQRTFNSIDGYTPRNNKLWCYPYHSIAINNGTGSEHIYRYELFRNPYNFIFSIAYAFNMESSSNCHPMDYAGMEENWDEGVVLANFPVCSWAGNVYANWFARNRLSLGQQFLNQGINLVSGVSASMLTLNPGPGISAIGQAAQSVAQIGDKSLYPYQIQGQVACDVSNVKWHRTGYEVKSYSIYREYAEIIDHYFDVFGYKVNRVGIPNTKSRTSWNYIKTIDVKITAPIPTEHLVTIKDNYNRGITFWHGNYVGDYSRTNNIVNPPPKPVYPDPTPAPDPPSPPTGEWGYPMVGWQDHVTSEWGWRKDPITGEDKFHNGIDIGFPVGTPILAIAAGRVINVAESSARGKYIDITVDETDNTTFYRCQHCDTIIAHEGDNVSLEEEIATVGETGRVTGPHLHLEIYINGESVNPRDYLTERS